MSASNEKLEALELKISHVLRGGVLLAGLLLVIGWCAGMFQHAGELPFAQFASYQAHPLTEIISTEIQTRDYARLIADFGLIVLISLPMIRVLMTAWLFFRSRDFVLATVAAVVLVALLISFSLGLEL